MFYSINKMSIISPSDQIQPRMNPWQSEAKAILIASSYPSPPTGATMLKMRGSDPKASGRRVTKIPLPFCKPPALQWVPLDLHQLFIWQVQGNKGGREAAKQRDKIQHAHWCWVAPSVPPLPLCSGPADMSRTSDGWGPLLPLAPALPK